MKRLTMEEFECLKRNLPNTAPTKAANYELLQDMEERKLLSLVPCDCDGVAHGKEKHDQYQVTDYGKLAMYCYISSINL